MHFNFTSGSKSSLKIQDVARKYSVGRIFQGQLFVDLMKQKKTITQGKKDYGKRMWTIEPVFGNITGNKGFNRLSLRGKAKLTTQWTICCIMHNIEKLWRYSNIARYA